MNQYDVSHRLHSLTTLLSGMLYIRCKYVECMYGACALFNVWSQSWAKESAEWSAAVVVGAHVALFHRHALYVY